MLKEIIPDPQDADLSDQKSPFQPYAPVDAVQHVADTAPLPAIVPERRPHQLPRLPFAPWRFMAIAAILITAIPCGIAAADPTLNTADAVVGGLLVAFVLVFVIPGKDI
ncbi:hypothetical protein [Microbacterium sp. 22242]|uniref:hypothetical protein n=1 Tax=Microbacterium sp. 22242 TaxID=3453896 RepID=UPI003F829714